MTATPPLTRDIGQAERSLRALLDRRLGRAGLSFPQWTVLVFLDHAEALSADELAARMVAGRVASEPDARVTVERLRASGMLAPVQNDLADGAGEAPRLTTTAAGRATYEPVHRDVTGIVEDLFANLPPDDLEATHRTLEEVARRANTRLGVEGS